VCESRSGLISGIGSSGRVQRLLVVAFLAPVRIVELLNCIVTVSLVKRAEHPASQSCPTETREVLPSSGKRCTMVAVVGSAAMGRCPVCVD
jgi:hypothetical protein